MDEKLKLISQEIQQNWLAKQLIDILQEIRIREQTRGDISELLREKEKLEKLIK